MRSAENGCLVIRRNAGIDKGYNKTVCRPAQITVLVDDSGADIEKYHKAFVGEKPEETILFELDGISFNPVAPCRIGFGDQLPEGKGIKEYLSELGLSEVEIEEVLDACELRKFLYNSCSQLSATQSRQLLLLKALHTDEKVLILNDPFQPFNGRWREYFAEALQRSVQQKGQIAIVLNLSFTPQTWSNQPFMREADVGRIVRPASAVKDGPKEMSAETTDVLSMDAATLERQAAATLRIPVPEPLRYAFSETKDFIFAPLARVSGFFRGYNGAISLVVFAVLIGFVAYFILPRIKDSKLAQNLLNFNPADSENRETTATEDITRKVSLVPEKAKKVAVSNADSSVEQEAADEELLSEQPLEAGQDEAVLSEDSELREPSEQQAETLPGEYALQGGPACLVVFDQYNLWYWSELPPVGEEVGMTQIPVNSM